MTTHQSKGGRARAEKLTPEQRHEIASAAARARWTEASNLPKATHTGTLKIGEAEIPCAVLSDGTRLLTQAGFLQALGRSSKPKGRSQQPTDGLPPFLATRSLKPLITDEILATTVPVVFITPTGGKALGYRAELLPKVCDLFLEARAGGLLTAQQQPLALQSEMLVRSLAKVGIVALVDEATGFQNERDRDELHKLLSVYLSEERLAWAKRFPDEFYRQIYRLKGWKWPVGRAKTPYLGHITNDIVYDRLPEGVLPKLQELNPTDQDSKRRKFKHHQFLSENVGQPDLRDHILQILPLMKISKSWEMFKRHLDNAFPKPGTQIEMDVDPL
ncbi:P63C domain-containing protein [Brevundimonas sp.]|uniref:P63C domain-containing protein n=1 Tax=Brevundimonas sp. TaxID=1871086 RepID=UPI00248964EB|nr:P63C domain-containing protein [Brevundimonas sp.]MDI1280415.1 P63C domain-containing protein [Brevundimonas sp.]